MTRILKSHLTNTEQSYSPLVAIASFVKVRSWAKDRLIKRGFSVLISQNTSYETLMYWYMGLELLG